VNIDEREQRIAEQRKSEDVVIPSQRVDTPVRVDRTSAKNGYE